MRLAIITAVFAAGIGLGYGTGRPAVGNDGLGSSLEIAQSNAIAATPTLLDLADDATELQCTPRSQCCRVCDRGKACGNSCINRNYNCHQGRGCACDSYEVCR